MSLLISLMNPLISLIPDFCLILLLLKLILSYKSLCQLITHCWTRLGHRAQFYQTFTIPKFDENSHENPLYRKSIIYLRSRPTSEDLDYLSLYSSPTRTDHFSVQLAPGRPVVEFFNGARIYWTKPLDGPNRLEIRVRRMDRVRVLRPYLMRVEAEADRIEQIREARIAAKRAMRRVIDALREGEREGEGAGRFRKVRKLWREIKRKSCF